MTQSSASDVPTARARNFSISSRSIDISVRCWTFMKKSRPVSFYIHDLNPWGGQDRSTLEIAQRLAKSRKVSAWTYTLVAQDSLIQHRRVFPWIRRPVVLKQLYFHLFALWACGWERF